MSNTKKNLGRVVFLHGLQTSKRDRRLHRLASAFHREGFCVFLPTYGYIPFFFGGIAQWLDRRIADSLAVFIDDDDILVGHSNGATIIYMIAKRVRIKGAILINAALEPNLAPEASFVHVYFNEGDWVTRLAALLPVHLWGEMGATGYTGEQENVLSINQGEPPTGLPALSGHSDIFKSSHLRPWSRYMALRCAEEVLRLAEEAGNYPELP